MEILGEISRSSPDDRYVVAEDFLRIHALVSSFSNQ